MDNKRKTVDLHGLNKEFNSKFPIYQQWQAAEESSRIQWPIYCDYYK